MSDHRPLVGCIALVLVALLLVGCGDDDDDNQGETPSTIDQASFCLNVEQTRQSLQEVGAAAAAGDPAAVVDARQDVSASVQYLYNASLELQGGTDLVANLQADMNEFNSLLATQDLAAAVPDLQAQAQTIENDLDQMEAAGNCP